MFVDGFAVSFVLFGAVYVDGCAHLPLVLDPEAVSMIHVFLVTADNYNRTRQQTDTASVAPALRVNFTLVLDVEVFVFICVVDNAHIPPQFESPSCIEVVIWLRAEMQILFHFLERGVARFCAI